ncbi:MAG: acyltransferase [Rothia sp. (in: high G+C Gram-positive bacteria)]|nr:acyltransferase [Rothia sp. (in: high G+C Gram-positive bacteria)]
MNIPYQKIAEVAPSIRWRLYEQISKRIYAHAFNSWGEGSVLISPLKLKGVEQISIGAKVAILEGAWLQTEQEGAMHIGDGTYIGHRSHLHAVADLNIGSGCVFADNVMVNSSEHTIGNLWKISTRGPINIGNNVFIGQNASILGGVTIGDNAVIGAGAVVTANVAPSEIVGGIPAKPLQ